MLKVFVRENVSPVAKNGFVFMSENMATFTQEQLVKKMAEYNTTLTEADALAALNVMLKIVMEKVKEGYAAQTPFGTFFAAAGGSAESKAEEFLPNVKETNHAVRMRFRPYRELSEDVSSHTVIERVSNAIKTRVYIDTVANADGKTDSPIKAGDTICIKGDFLKFDSENEVHGIFLSDGETEYRLSYYTQITGGTVCARVESSIPAGSYKLIIRNKPTVDEASYEYKKQIVIS
ncbi:DNA-binding domain-containing protein [Treponema sp. C6A8]|uniref:DNA-binding domain-containing protein n=1 Tax=Treponema sp. C6A8 TaxID=1410609 RepID=UPI00048675E0|nr:DNA-binding domain-containing protein [Treponema sp. C6A8]